MNRLPSLFVSHGAPTFVFGAAGPLGVVDAIVRRLGVRLHAPS